jgi:hypothetical protein
MFTFILIVITLLLAAVITGLITIGFLKIESLLSSIIDQPLIPEDPGAALVTLAASFLFISTFVILYHTPQPRAFAYEILSLFETQTASADSSLTGCAGPDLPLNTLHPTIETTSTGQQIITVNSEKKQAIAWTPINDTFTNFTLEVDLLHDCGLGSHEYGLIVRKGHQHNFYQFTLTPTTLSTKEYQSGRWTTLQHIPVSTLTNPPAQANRLKLVANTDQLSFYLNNNHLFILNRTDFIIGGVGLIVTTHDQGQSKVTFDNLVIY